MCLISVIWKQEAGVMILLLASERKKHDYICLLATFLLYLRHQYELANHLLSTAYEKICTKTNSDAPAHSPWWNERMGTRVELYFSL